MDPVSIDDPRIPASFRKRIIEDEETGCWLWSGSQTPTGHPTYRRKSAWRWIFEHLYGPLPEGPGPTTCDYKPCVNPYHRLVEPAETQPHRCSVCRKWCNAAE